MCVSRLFLSDDNVVFDLFDFPSRDVNVPF